MPERQGGEDVRPAEVNEADWLESHREPDGAPEEGLAGSLGERLDEAGEGDLVESGVEEPADEIPGELPPDAPVADVLEQHQVPTGGEEEEEWR